MLARLLLVRMVPAGILGGLATHAAAAEPATSGDHQLVTGLLTSLGVVAAAAITGYFGLLIARSRAPEVVSTRDHVKTVDTAGEANEMLAGELQRKETVIAYLTADNAQLRVRLGQVEEELKALKRRRRTA